MSGSRGSERFLNDDKTQFDKVVNDNGIIVPSYMLSW